MAIMDVVILIAVVLGLASMRANQVIWIAVMGVVLLFLSLFGHLSFLILFPCWLVFIAAALFVQMKNYRLRYFTKPLMQKLQKRMPAISRTEREAIEAGDVWWEKDLFCGRPQWKKLLAIPQPQLTDEELNFLNTSVETLCTMIDDWQIVSQDHDLSPAVWSYLKRERFLGMVIPKEYGGHGFSALAHSTIIIKIATRSISAAVNTMVPNSLGPAELLLHYGTSEQKDYYLPRLARGEEIPCFALTGPDAGSDAGSITDTGIVCRGNYEGNQVLGIRLTWDKRYITLAPVATVLGVAFRLYDPDHLLGMQEDVGITLALIPAAHAGVQIGNRHLPLHLAFMNGPTRGKDVFIPIDWIIGGVDMAGKGWKMLMECLSVGRSISLPALGTACGKLSYRVTGAYASLRKQFNTSIAHFEGVGEALSQIGGLTYLLEACRIMTVGAVDQKIKPSTVSAIAKYHMTEMARQIINHAMDIHAGQGIQVGPRNFLAHAYLAMPISITVEGANILTRNLIIFGQGAIRCHPYVLQEVELLAAEGDKEQELDRLLLSHMGYTLSHLARNIWGGLTGGKLFFSPVRGKTARYYRQLTRMSAALALLADVSMMILGGSLKRKEHISARLGDMLSELYLASTVLKYYHDQAQPVSDLCYVTWCIETCLSRIQIACDDLLDNFPMRWLGKLLRWLIFPFGTAYRKPRDTVSQDVVDSMLMPSELRDRVTRHCYVSQSPQDAIHRLEDAFAKRLHIDPIAKKFQNAIRNGTVSSQGDFEERAKAALEVGILTADEFNDLCDFEVLRREVIQVNEFSLDLRSIIT